MVVHYRKLDWHTEATDIKELYRQWTQMDFDASVDRPAGFFYGALVDRTLVGAVQVIMMADPFRHRIVGLIENVFVLPEFRHQKIGRAMMEYTLASAKALGCQQVRLTTHQGEGLALYRAMGMREGSAFYEVFS